jgi:hypothetical protein
VTNKGDHPKWSGVTKEVTVNWFVCTQPLCDPPGVLTCPTLGCPGGCGVECITPTTTIPLSIGPVLAALACVVLLSLRRRDG